MHRLIRIATLALLAAMTACAGDRALAPVRIKPALDANALATRRTGTVVAAAPSGASYLGCRGPTEVPRGPVLVVLNGRVIGVDSGVDVQRAVRALDPNRIADVTVMKAPMAVARFGPGAAQGALLITTK